VPGASGNRFLVSCPATNRCITFSPLCNPTRQQTQGVAYRWEKSDTPPPRDSHRHLLQPYRLGGKLLDLWKGVYSSSALPTLLLRTADACATMRRIEPAFLKNQVITI
jgi:hypothetical protein